MQMSLDYLSFVTITIKKVKLYKKNCFCLYHFFSSYVWKEHVINRPYVGHRTNKELEKYFIKWLTNIFGVHFTDSNRVKRYHDNKKRKVKKGLKHCM